MKICVYGAGAVGGHIAARLASTGHDVSVVARGPHLDVMRRRGLTLRVAGKEIVAPVRASDRPADLGAQDIVIVTLKATALSSFARDVAPLLGPETAIVFVQNGIPWWYAHGLSPQRPRPPDLSRLDPGGHLAAAVAGSRVIGAVIYTSNEVVEPGIVENDSVGANTLLVGEPDDTQSPRIQALRSALEAAEIGSPVVEDIRATLWRRLLVNISGSTVCMLVEQPVRVVSEVPAIADLFAALSREGSVVAAAHGVDVERGAVPAGAPYRFPGHHKPSMLQDFERRRPMEIEGILITPRAFAREAGVTTPAMDAVVALASARAAGIGLYELAPA